MKSVLQIIALWLFGLNPMAIILTLGSMIVFLQLLINKSLETLKIKRRNRETADRIWTIE